MEERGPGDVSDGRPNLLPGMDHVHSERVHRIPPDVVSIHPRDEHLALVVVHEETPDHLLHKKNEENWGYNR